MENRKFRERDMKKLSEVWARSRCEAGKSQEYMALEMGVSRKTVQNWEKGVSAPSIDKAIEWFRVLGESPMPFLFAYVFPEMEGCSGDDDEKELRKNVALLLEEMPPEGLRQLLFLFYGNHGSSPRAILQLVNAHLQTPMKDRVSQAGVVINNYELALLKGNLAAPDEVKPDLEMLKRAYEEGRRAVLEDIDGYVM